MIDIKHSVRVFVDKRDSRVIVRVRWYNKKREVCFSSGVYAQLEKWDEDLHRAKKGTTHTFQNMKFTAAQINERIANFKEAIEVSFAEFGFKNCIPSNEEFKNSVNEKLQRDTPAQNQETIVKKNFKELFETFLLEVGRERNWDKLAKEKYTQAYNQITSAVPYITPDKITIDTMYRLREWYVANEYKNRTIEKQIVMVKAILRWIDQQDGYSIPAKVLEFDPNLTVIRRTVTYLHYDELIIFSEFKFEEGDETLDHARDLWCFMAFTSLRYSDLAALKKVHIRDNRIDMYTQKTNEHITIPLTEQARKIIDKHKEETADSIYVFNVISNQKLNDYVKLAAEKAGLNREVLETYYVGNKRNEEVHKFYEIISCHDARRTFVSCSLAMNIPPEVVMKCTGHHSYNTMKPYIETATETQTQEMEKWNKNKYRSLITSILDQASESELKEIHKLVVEYAQSKKEA